MVRVVRGVRWSRCSGGPIGPDGPGGPDGPRGQPWWYACRKYVVNMVKTIKFLRNVEISHWWHNAMSPILYLGGFIYGSWEFDGRLMSMMMLTMTMMRKKHGKDGYGCIWQSDGWRWRLSAIIHTRHKALAIRSIRLIIWWQYWITIILEIFKWWKWYWTWGWW